MLEVTCQGSDVEVVEIEGIPVLRVFGVTIPFIINIPLSNEAIELLLSTLSRIAA